MLGAQSQTCCGRMGYLHLKGLMALFRNIYLRFEGLVAEYKRPQDRMISMAIGAQYSGYHVLATP